jgi:very-short-patch-repair endonuclease
MRRRKEPPASWQPESVTRSLAQSVPTRRSSRPLHRQKDGASRPPSVAPSAGLAKNWPISLQQVSLQAPRRARQAQKATGPKGDPARPRLRPGTSPVRQEVAMSRPSHARNTQLEVRAREMRLCPTLSEARLWQALRGGQLGVGFRRQAVFGDYSVDFLGPAVSLVVEVDGGYHSRRCRADARRDRISGHRAWRVGAEVARSHPSIDARNTAESVTCEWVVAAGMR